MGRGICAAGADIRMSSTRKRTITVHISPYVGGLAPETHDFIRRLNEEARRLRTGVSFIGLGNRILADGIIERALKFANTLGALVLRRAFADGYLAHRPQPRWETPAIEGEEVVLRRGSSGHRKELRRFEKNNLPFECDCTICGGRFECRSIKEYVERQGICWGCGFENKIKIAAETLYHLVCAIPRAERDSEEIYPDDFRKVLIPLPLQSNWNWRELERRYREGMLPCGVSSGALLGRDSLGLRDYAEPARLLFKYGRYELATRQKAASPVRHIRIALEPTVDYLALLVPTATQRALERTGRLYKNSRCLPNKNAVCSINAKRALTASCKRLGVRPILTNELRSLTPIGLR